jgi:hypothetical protein
MFGLLDVTMQEPVKGGWDFLVKAAIAAADSRICVQMCAGLLSSHLCTVPADLHLCTAVYSSAHPQSSHTPSGPEASSNVTLMVPGAV